MSNTYIFYIDGMTCVSCSGSIKTVLKNKLSSKLKDFHVDLTTADPKKTIVRLNDTEELCDHKKVWFDLKESIEEIGFNCREYEYSPNTIEEPIQHNHLNPTSMEQCATPDESRKSLSDKTHTKQTQQNSLAPKIPERVKKLVASHWFLGALGCVSGLAVLIACLVTGGPIWMIPIAAFSTLLTLSLGANSYREAWLKLTKTGTLTMDSLFALSSLSILTVSITSLFVPWLPMMFEAGLLIYGFRHIGIAIEDTIKEKISTGRFQDRAPQRVRKQIDEGFEEVSLKSISIHDEIIINPGELIPLDGICDNPSILYDTIITGSTLPRHCAPQEKVLAGMRLADNAPPLKIRVLQTHEHAYLARLDAAIEQSSLEKAPIEIKTSQLLTYFIPVIIGIAIVSGVIMGLFFPPALAIQCAISVLVSACPCTLGLITPLAVKTGIHKAAEYGVHFKSAKTVQQAEQIDTVIFDLNGTLTTGSPQVKEHSFDKQNISESEFLSLCAALEQSANHPIGKAIYSFAHSKSTETLTVTQLDESHHSGITGVIKNKSYLIGSSTLMHEQGISIPSELNHATLAAGDQCVYLASDNKIIGFMVLTDPLRKDAYDTVNALKAMGKEIHLCTGADQETALRYAKYLNIDIDKVEANRLANSIERDSPSKTAYIAALKQKGRLVAMVGDAGNDAQAIAASDLGIAIASEGGDELTQQAAGIVIHNGTLMPIASAFELSKQTVTNINQNLTMSLVYNLSSIVAAVSLTLSPFVCVALMISQACLILMNVYRMKQKPLEHLQHTTKDPLKEHLFEESSPSKINRYTAACCKSSRCEGTAPAITTQPPTHSTRSFLGYGRSMANSQKNTHDSSIISEPRLLSGVSQPQ